MEQPEIFDSLQAEPDEKSEPTERRKRLVSELQSRVEKAKGFHEKAFAQMKLDMDSVLQGYTSKEQSGDFYIANILQRHVQQRVAALYAKNPVAIAKRRDRKDYSVWDEQEDTLKMSFAAVKAQKETGVEAPDKAREIVEDYESVQSHRRMLDNVAETMEYLFEYYMNEQEPSYKSQMKALVRRVITTGIGFVKVGFQRDVGRQPEVSARISDIQGQLDHMRRIATQAKAGHIDKDAPEMEELLLSLRALQEEPEITLREGLIFDFPDPDSIIVDPMCRQLRGFVGATWVAHEMYMSVEDVMEIYEVDLENDYTSYDFKGKRSSFNDPFKRWGDFQFSGNQEADGKEGMVLVWEVYDRRAGLQYCIADGFSDFLMEPQSPPVSVESFWPIYTLVFNEIEHKDHLYPPSDVSLLLPMQHEYNRARQGLREHRRANRPKYAAPAGMLEPGDKEKLREHPANALIELQALAAGQKVNDVIQPISQIGIDPNLYEVKTIFDDVQLVAGQQEATYGQVSKATATETSIAESSRTSALGAQVDELDSFMSDITRSAGQVLLGKMSRDKVKEIVGPGAVWPEMDRLQIMQEVFLEIEAGSTGKPNKAAELRNIERIVPFLLQIPGISPEFLAKELLKRLDDKLDLTQALTEKIPSIVAINQAQGMVGAGGGNSPSQQGDMGARNAPRPRKVAGGGAPVGSPG